MKVVNNAVVELMGFIRAELPMILFLCRYYSVDSDYQAKMQPT